MIILFFKLKQDTYELKNTYMAELGIPLLVSCRIILFMDLIFYYIHGF